MVKFLTTLLSCISGGINYKLIIIKFFHRKCLKDFFFSAWFVLSIHVGFSCLTFYNEVGEDVNIPLLHYFLFIHLAKRNRASSKVDAG